MGESRLRPLTGEFCEPGLEATFQRQRLAETVRHARLLLAGAVLVNGLFLLAELRVLGTRDFVPVIGARLMMIGVTAVCFRLAGRTLHYRELERILIAWQWVMTCAFALIIGLRGNISLPVGFVLPAIYYLAVPVSFRWTLVNGLGTSALLILAYMGARPEPWPLVVVGMWVLMLNVALSIVALHNNRLSRLGWCAMRAERRALTASARSNELMQKTFMAVPFPLLITDPETGQILQYNDAGMRYFGGTPEQFGITNIEQIYVSPAARARFRDLMRQQGQATDFETEIRLGSGEVRTVMLEGTTVEMDGRLCLVCGVVDITARLAAEQKAHHAAHHDVLTGLPNRAAFQQALEAAFATGAKVCLLLVDLDSLKDVNDTFGHDAGDALLVESGRRLQHLVNHQGQVARLGGDEFVVLLTELDMEAARALAQSIVEDFRRPMIHGSRPLSTKASVGIAMRPDRDLPPGDLLKDADLALYAAKQQGRNRAVMYAPAMRQAMKERVSLHRALTDAVAGQAIIPFYQPKISLLTGRIVGFEALMRWRQGPQAFLAPGAFDLAFQDPDLAVLIGDSMVRQVAWDMRGWLDAGQSFGRMAVNLSPAQFTHFDLGRLLLGRFDEAGVPAHHFEVEVTETVFLGRHVEHVAPILDQLYRAGVCIALDDFGTGYAALSQLRQLPINTIKIDQSFIEDVEGDAFDAAIVCAVLELGKTIGMQVVAEGVETLGQARFLAGRGCEVVQGFLYARPMPAARIADLLAAETDATAASRLSSLQPA